MANNTVDGVATARKFHETYERLAPSFGYQTRVDTKEFDPDSPNGKLMTAVCQEVGSQIYQAGFDAARREAAIAKRNQALDASTQLGGEDFSARIQASE